MKEVRRKEVIVVAGPSASGKSYLMRQLTTKKKTNSKTKFIENLISNLKKLAPALA